MRMKRKLFDRITVNPKVCMGQPTIRGMRITVAFIEYASWLAGEYYFHLPVSIE